MACIFCIMPFFFYPNSLLFSEMPKEIRTIMWG